MAATSPWPETATADQLGALLDISGRRVRELASEGTFPRLSGGRYPAMQCVHAYVDAIRSAAKIRSSPDPEILAAALDGRRERARLARLQADRVELEIEREHGRLVDADEIQRHYTQLVVEARNRLLGVPSAAKGSIPHLTVDEIETIEGLIVRALEDVADGSDDNKEEA